MEKTNKQKANKPNKKVHEAISIKIIKKMFFESEISPYTSWFYSTSSGEKQ